MSGNHVALTKCFLCNGDSDLLIARSLNKDISELHGKCVNTKPCSKCAEHQRLGVIVIGFDEAKTDDEKNPWRTGHWFVIKDDGFSGWLKHLGADQKLIDQGLAQRVMFVPGNVIDATIGDQLKDAPHG